MNITELCDPHHQSTEYQRGNNHLNQSDENRSEEFDILTVAVDELLIAGLVNRIAHNQTEEHGYQNGNRKTVFFHNQEMLQTA